MGNEIKETIVLDSFALLCFLKDEKGSDEVEKIIQSAYSGICRLMMSTMNFGEVFYILCREKDVEFALREEAEIVRLPIEFVETDWDLIREAAIIKAKYPMAFADCFAAAVAHRTNASIMTGDPEFKLIEKDVKIRWLNK